MKKPQFAAIIFDMDGTLVDSEVVWEAVEAEMMRQRGVEYNDEVRQQVIGLRLDEFFQKLIDIYGFDESVEALAGELNERMLEQIPQRVQPKPGAQAIIEYAAGLGIPYCIASSSPLAIIDATIRAQGWEELIPHRFSADQVARGKPAPDVYLHAAQRLGVPPSACLALEDSPNGARSAVAAGMTCYVIPDAHSAGSQFQDITPHVYASLHDVLNALRD